MTKVQANKVKALIHLRWGDDFLTHMQNTDNLIEMSVALRDCLDNTLTKVGCTQVWQKFGTSRPLPNEIDTKYFTQLINFCEKLIGAIQLITDNILKTHIITSIPN